MNSPAPTNGLWPVILLLRLAMAFLLLCGLPAVVFGLGAALGGPPGHRDEFGESLALTGLLSLVLAAACQWAVRACQRAQHRTGA
ncbi:hypothetical protein [Ideonella alba]|uniref:Uncharacterized protein n=1 Tax=Ideonella alba TaxID=2824118 RepID=A0A940YB42_9BURK|nr:hypothetical protein [Ideonella alba]MBQ0929060.1 hypothetical protein [Ideonella alba]